MQVFILKMKLLINQKLDRRYWKILRIFDKFFAPIIMYYDTNVDIKYAKKDISSLECSEYSGFCISKQISQRDINKLIEFNLPFTLKTKNIYKKLTVSIDNPSYNTKHLLNKYDVICLKLPDTDKPVDENMCDSVTFDFTKPIKFKNINPNIFYEFNISDSLYNKKDRLIWMYNVKALLKYTKCQNVVIGSGASCCTELKSPLDIQKMLLVFGISNDKCKLIMNNSMKLLEKCASKRFMSSDCIFNDVNEGSLKEDFLIKKMKTGKS